MDRCIQLSASPSYNERAFAQKQCTAWPALVTSAYVARLPIVTHVNLLDRLGRQSKKSFKSSTILNNVNVDNPGLPYKLV